MHTIEHDVLSTLRVQDSGVPIYVQLRDQMMRAIGSGRLAAGARLPTLRQVAVARRVGLNTVRRAYDALERAGAVTLQRGRGSFVCAAPPMLDPELEAARLDDLAQRTLGAAAAAGLDPRALAERLVAMISQGAPRP